MLAAGIDLGGRTMGTTAIARIDGSHGAGPRVLEVQAGAELRGDRGDAQILVALGSPGVVAVDAPLTLPHPITCTTEDCPVCFPAEGAAPQYGSRPQVDSAAAWKSVDHIEKAPIATAMLAGIAFRAIYLARLLRRSGIDVIEVWPMGAYRALARTPGIAVRGDDGDDEWRRALLAPHVEGVDKAIPRGETAERDRLDAVAAAFVGWLWLAGEARSVPPGAERDGEAIWIP
jgi:predicted nuclease with RNAse H fold